MSNDNTSFMYDGISVSNVQNPQFCAQCASSTAQNAFDLNIERHGIDFFSSVVEQPSADSINAFSFVEILWQTDGELTPNQIHAIVHTPVKLPEM